MLTAVTALLISSLAGGIFGSVAIYTYVDSSEEQSCNTSETEYIDNEEHGYDNYGYQEEYSDPQEFEEDSNSEMEY
jgi:hypothetical protein